MEFKVAVSIGHNPNSPGISIGQYSEYSEMAPVAGLLIQTLMYHGIKPFMIGTGSLQKKVAEINAINPDIAIELHLNGGGGDGAETLYCPGSEAGKVLAEYVNEKIIQFSKEPNRGVKEGWYRMEVGGIKDYFLEKTACPAIITEAYFMDNNQDRRDFAGDIEYSCRLAFAIASGIINYQEKF